VAAAVLFACTFSSGRTRKRYNVNQRCWLQPKC